MSRGSGGWWRRRADVGAVGGRGATVAGGVGRSVRRHPTVTAAVAGSSEVQEALVALAGSRLASSDTRDAEVSVAVFIEGGRKAIRSKTPSFAQSGLDGSQVLTYVEAVLEARTSVVSAAAALEVSTNTMTRYKAVYIAGGRFALEQAGLARAA